MRHFSNIEEIRAANRDAGLFFFSPDTMRFFRSRVGRELYGGRFFITSEQFDDAAPRWYSVRCANRDGSIDTVSFQGYATEAEATLAAKALARLDEALIR
jgi:hypothetical protein